MGKNRPPGATVRIKRRVTCPHCWHAFPPEDILWIARQNELIGDPVLGPEAALRFLPSRFTIQGQALDPKGFVSQGMACPRCHLPIPRHLMEFSSLFISIVGAPACGKSYFLASMTWEMRQEMSRAFCLSFADADPEANRMLTEYEELLFLNPKPTELVAIRKTELRGELYDDLFIDGQETSLPKPFMFTLRPTPQHPKFASLSNTSPGMVLVLYDNAGEHFLPGAESVGSPVTEHLARSRVILFMFDPTQDLRFRSHCHSSDPQMDAGSRVIRQETVFHELANRVRRHLGVAESDPVDRALAVVVSKWDSWAELLDEDMASEPIVGRKGVSGLDMGRVEATSAQIRKLLADLCPEFVAAAENFSDYVVYVPVSALGRAPIKDDASGALGIQPELIKPAWAAVPILYVFAKWSKGLVGIARDSATG